jgi:hypothetical protein
MAGALLSQVAQHSTRLPQAQGLGRQDQLNLIRMGNCQSSGLRLRCSYSIRRHHRFVRQRAPPSGEAVQVLAAHYQVSRLSRLAFVTNRTMTPLLRSLTRMRFFDGMTYAH